MVVVVMMVEAALALVGRAVCSQLLGLGTESGERSCWCDAVHVSVRGKAAGAAHTGAL